MMPLLDKIISSRNTTKRRKDAVYSEFLRNCGFQADDRNLVKFNTDQVRILLFQECEWRGKKLLFDSIAVKKINSIKSQKNELNNDLESKNESHVEIVDGITYEHEKVARDDVKLLSEMVFGTVAMTYRGPSFKVHAIDTPPCIMCTKIFSAPEHNACKQINNRHSDEILGQFMNIDSNSSDGSLRTYLSYPSSVNSSGNSLIPDTRKNSTSSSNGSGWTMDTLSPPGSSQSLESSGSSGIGSLSSLRRRWLRAVSTSLSHSESNELCLYGGQQHAGDANNPNYDNPDDHEFHIRRHKTRLGLVMLVQLTAGYERKMEETLLEHITFLEGMLDRLCCTCFEKSSSTSCGYSQSKGKGKGKGKTNNNVINKSLIARMYRASTNCTLWLLRLLTDSSRSPTPLLWHDILLNSTVPAEIRITTLYHELQKMFWLVDNLDTKSTNFFLSTVITAVLTCHLGWVHTVLSSQDRQLVKKLGKQYPCNPLWTQLGDLYGAVGNPMKLVHTVIAGDPDKVELINAVLTFLSYFVRSGIVEKKREYRCPHQKDVQEAIVVLEKARKRQPKLQERVRSCSKFMHESSASRSSTWHQDELLKLNLSSPWNKTSSLAMKRSETFEKNLNAFGSFVKESSELQRSKLSIFKEEYKASEVKIIVSESPPTEITVDKKHLQTASQFHNFESTKKYELDISLQLAKGKSDNESYTLKSIDNLKNFEKAKMFELSNTLDGVFQNIKVATVQTNQPRSFDKILKIDLDESKKVDSKILTTGSPKNSSPTNFGMHKKFEGITSKFISNTKKNASTLSYEYANLSNTEARKLYSDYFEDNNIDSDTYNGTNATSHSIGTKIEKQSRVLWTLGEEEKPPNISVLHRPSSRCNCQSSFTFTRVPSTSAQLPEGVLRKIIQRNFPESSKSIQSGPECSSTERSMGFCLKCNRNSDYSTPQNYESNKLLLETPTNATEVLRSCNTSGRTSDSNRNNVKNGTAKIERYNSLEALIEANGVVELPMPRSKKILNDKMERKERAGFPSTLLHRKVYDGIDSEDIVAYTWGLVMQGLIKRKKKRKRKSEDFTTMQDQKQKELEKGKEGDSDDNKEWWHCMREEVGILSNHLPSQNPPVRVGMSRLVANMLEAFSYVWKKYRSPIHCVEVLESKLREMWLRSKALSESLMSMEECEASIANLNIDLDLDAADIPLLLAVATTHSPRLAHRFGISLV
ncbi:uncharacterized protein LOC107271645 isoform X2 [Cephus cinctus]|uniref:Uncharacterized protein LOC107271645 isoform X2 n=1 Tax=Cephus cinctus TaxID=211228 RepID=A0AAJ7RP84_CEPCN|nr:uncharacterized protein LOC107271645 isoform X2 [Cephus cinctus]